MNDENHWYGEGWRTLRRQVLNLAMAQSADLSDALDAGESENTIRERIENFAARVQQAIAARIDARSVGLWNFALQVWPEAALLQAAFLNDLPALRGAKPDVLPEQALRENLRLRLEDEWRRLNPHRLAVWRRLDKISDRILAESADPLGHRCTSRHFLAVHRFLREHHPNDHNLPRTYEAVEAYFLEFSADCRDHAVDPEHLSDTAVDDFLQDLDLDLLPGLARCLERLASQDPELYEIVAALYGLGPVRYVSQTGFRKARRLGRRALEKRHRAVIERLRACIEQAIKEPLQAGES